MTEISRPAEDARVRFLSCVRSDQAAHANVRIVVPDLSQLLHADLPHGGRPRLLSQLPNPVPDERAVPVRPLHRLRVDAGTPEPRPRLQPHDAHRQRGCGRGVRGIHHESAGCVPDFAEHSAASEGRYSSRTARGPCLSVSDRRNENVLPGRERAHALPDAVHRNLVEHLRTFQVLAERQKQALAWWAGRADVRVHIAELGRAWGRGRHCPPSYGKVGGSTVLVI